MVVVDIYRYPRDEDAEVWAAELVARLTVRDGDIIPRVEGKEPELIDFDRPLPGADGTLIFFRDAPQEWARALPRYFNSRELFAESADSRE